jgi:hypothetical protein
MTLPAKARVRRKAVWGSRRGVVALLFAALGVAPIAGASTKPAHAKQAATATPGIPGPHVKAYKVDDELTRRAASPNTLATSRVIVTLVPGAQLPAQFKKYGRGGKLDIINGQVLELPNGTTTSRTAARTSIRTATSASRRSSTS